MNHLKMLVVDTKMNDLEGNLGSAMDEDAKMHGDGKAEQQDPEWCLI